MALLWQIYLLKQLPMENYYSILGIDSSASYEEIKKRYRELAKELHPDVNPLDEAAEKFKKINAAYETLSDANLRKEYDELLNQNTNSFKQYNYQYWNSTIAFLAIASLVVIIASLIHLNKKKPGYSI